MTQLTHVNAQYDQMERLTATLDEGLTQLAQLAGRLDSGYPTALSGAWAGEAHDRFSLSLKEAGQALAALREEYQALTQLLGEAADGYGRAESEALRLAGLEVSQ